MTSVDDVATPTVPPRERILNAAYELFSRRGIRAVGTDEVIERAGVARATLYRHFATKNDLVLAVLERREQLWTHGLIEAQSHLRGSTPEERLLAIFDVMHDWFQLRDGYEGCSFINVLLELGPEHPAGQACLVHIEHVRDIVRRRAVAAVRRASCWSGSHRAGEFAGRGGRSRSRSCPPGAPAPRPRGRRPPRHRPPPRRRRPPLPPLTPAASPNFPA